MEGLLDFGGFEGVTDVAPLDDAAASIPDIGALADAMPVDDALRAAYQDWLGAGNEGTIQDFLTTQEPAELAANIAPTAFAGQPLESIGDFKAGEIVGLEKSAFSPDASFGGRFMANAAPAPFGGSFAAPAGGVSLPRPDVGSLAFNPQSFADTAPTTLASVGVGENVFAPPVAPLAQFGGLPSREAPSLPPVQALEGESPAQLDQAGNRRLPSFMEPGYADGFTSGKRPDPRAPLRQGIIDTAKALGIRPVDLATAISYETAGTFDPTKRGPTTQWGQHRGLIQFGEPQARKYGVDWDKPLESQLGPDGAVAKYLRDTGVKPGMGLLDVYSAINAGGVGRYNRTDANNGGAPGTVRDKVETQMEGHRAKAEALMSGDGGVADAPGAFRAAAARQATEARNVAMRDPGMFTEAAPRDMGIRAPQASLQKMQTTPGSTDTARAAPPSAPQGRMTMPQISPDEELYSMGLVRDPAGGGMIENVAIRPPGMAMGADGAYIDAGAVPAAAAIPTSAPAGFGGFGGIASGISRMFGGGESASASDGVPRPFTNPFAFFGAAAEKNRQMESEWQGKVALVNELEKRGMPRAEAISVINNSTAMQLAMQRNEDARLRQARAQFNQSIASDLSGQPAAAPSPSPGSSAASLDGMQEEKTATPTDGATSTQSQAMAQSNQPQSDRRQRLMEQQERLSRRLLEAPDDKSRDNIKALIANLDRQIAAIPDPLDRQKKELDLQKARRDLEKDDGGKIRAEIAARREEVAAQGKNPNDPRWESYIMTGKMPREDAQPLSASDKKAINQAEDEIIGFDNAIESLKRAKELNPKAYSGLGAGALGTIGTSGIPGAGLIVDKDRAKATREFNQIMSGQAIEQMSQTLKGATTDREMAQFVEILGNPSTPPEIRERTIDRMLTLAQRQRDLAAARARDIRGGDYYKSPEQKQADAVRKGQQQGGNAAQPAAPAPKPAEAPRVQEGTTAVNPNTGQRITFTNGQWVPAQ